MAARKFVLVMAFGYDGRMVTAENVDAMVARMSDEQIDSYVERGYIAEVKQTFEVPVMIPEPLPPEPTWEVPAYEPGVEPEVAPLDENEPEDGE